MNRQPVSLFYSYAHRDERLRNQLAKQLKILERTGIISSWHDRNIDAGQEWSKSIDEHLRDAKVILLLVSPDFIASDYCYDIEMAHALDRHNRGEAVVIPIFLRKTLFELAPFAKLQGLPTTAKPVVEWRSRDDAFADIAKGIQRVAERLQVKPNLSEEPDIDAAPAKRDAERISKYRQLFQRSAFSIPCVFEGSLTWLGLALEQIAVGFGTGKVRDQRTSETLYSVPRRAEFETTQFLSALDQADRIMLFTKRTIHELKDHLSKTGRFKTGGKEEDYLHMEFLLRGLIYDRQVDKSFVRTAFEYMDRVDAQRNAILELLNGLFEKEGDRIPPVPVSSHLLAESAKMDSEGRKNDWNNFYLREHKIISGFIQE